MTKFGPSQSKFLATTVVLVSNLMALKKRSWSCNLVILLHHCLRLWASWIKNCHTDSSWF